MIPNKFLRMFFLLICSVLLTLSLILSLFLFGLDQTLYSWRFFSYRLNESAVPLSDQELHEDMVKDFAGILTDSMGTQIPFEIKRMIEIASIETFTASWIVDQSGEAIKAVQAVLKKKTKKLDISLPLQGFKSNLAVLLYRQGRFTDQEIQQGMRDIPNQINIRDIIPEEEINRLVRQIRAYPFYANLLMYLLPLLFIVLLLTTGSLKGGSLCAGFSFLISGSVVFWGGRYLSRHIISLGYRYYKDNLIDAFEIPLKAGVEDFVQYMRPAIYISLIGGVVFITLGYLLDRALKNGQLLSFMKNLKISSYFVNI